VNVVVELSPLNLCASRGLPDVARGLNGKILFPRYDTIMPF
jgi:hypothetical protein